MEKQKIQIEVNNRTYDKDIIYAAVSLRGGYIVRDYIVDNQHFESNYAFFNVLFNYYRLLEEMKGIHFDVQRAASTISFYKKRIDFISTLESVLNIMFKHEYDSGKFEEAKQITKEAFALRYKEGAFRSKYKGYEFSDLNKRFTLKQLINDIENISFEDFTKISKVIVVPGNVCVYILGQTSELDFSMISFENYVNKSSVVRIAGVGFDPYLRQNAYVINKAREEHNLIIEAIDFLNVECTNFTKLIIAELLAEQIPTHEIDIWVDSLDASVMFPSEQLREYKSLLCIDNRESYNIAQKKLLVKYVSLLENSPEIFAIRAAYMMGIGVYIDQYLEFLDKCSYELFAELCDKADYRITEAQIVLRKESR